MNNFQKLEPLDNANRALHALMGLEELLLGCTEISGVEEDLHEVKPSHLLALVELIREQMEESLEGIEALRQKNGPISLRQNQG